MLILCAYQSHSSITVEGVPRRFKGPVNPNKKHLWGMSSTRHTLLTGVGRPSQAAFLQKQQEFSWTKQKIWPSATAPPNTRGLRPEPFPGISRQSPDNEDAPGEDGNILFILSQYGSWHVEAAGTALVMEFYFQRMFMWFFPTFRVGLLDVKLNSSPRPVYSSLIIGVPNPRVSLECPTPVASKN